MVRYLYAWTPLVVVGTVFLLSLPWLGLFALIALMTVSLVALAAFAWAIVSVPQMVGHTISRRWQDRGGASPRTAVLEGTEHRQLLPANEALVHPDANSDRDAS
jgi:hypothetical protein